MADNSVLSEADMDLIGEEFAILQPNTCVVMRPGRRKDAAGAPLGDMETIGSFRCRIDEGASGVQRLFGASIAAQSSCLVSLRRGTPIRAKDVIIESGRELHVVFAPKPSYSFELTVAAMAKSHRDHGGGSTL